MSAEWKAVVRVGFPAMVLQWAIGEVPWMQGKAPLVASTSALVTLVAVYLAVRFALRSAPASNAPAA